MRRWPWAVLLSIAGAGASAAEVRGRVELYSGGQALRAVEAADAVVYFRPRAPIAVQPAVSGAVMSTRRKQFVPRVLPITVGSTVRFPNEDPILHNVFSTSVDNSFDLGLYGSGAGSEYLFRNPGLVKVYCNVHHSMFGFVLVLDTPYFTRPNAQGSFELTGLPDGEGELVVFHDRAALPWRQRILTQSTPELAIRIDLNKRKVPQHMNKFGKPYRRGANANPY
jgi:plastocyanin